MKIFLVSNLHFHLFFLLVYKIIQKTCKDLTHVKVIQQLCVYHAVQLFCFCVSGVSQSVLITQWPHYISSLPSGRAEIHCYQNDTDYEYLYWYRQTGKHFQLMVVIIAGNENFEDELKSGFQAEKLKEKQWSLTIPSIQRKDEAVYLCAASLHSAVADLRSVTKTYHRGCLMF